MKEIKLTQGKVALVDDEDFDMLTEMGKWHFNGGYANNTARKSKLKMHRVILGATAGMQVDHYDGNTLNNQRSNLRLCTNSENMRNRRKYSNNKSGFKGVCWTKGAWQAAIRFNRVIYIGRFSDATEAARAYDKKAKELHGEFAKLNFD